MENSLSNTSPLKNGELRLSRKFLGNIFPKNGFEKAEYKAYLKGHERFFYGLDTAGNYIVHTTRQKYFYTK